MLNYFSQHHDGRDATEHLKDSRFKTVVVGYLVPLLICLAVVGNCLAGRVYLPAGRFSGDMWDGLVQSWPIGLRFYGVIVLKLGFAGAFFSWYGLANHNSTERYSVLCLLAAVIVSVAGLLIYSVSWF
ncbi:MAG: hypothetical protein H6817_10440 [Phycisphaerales bacterium]|nr:hypothetical protein [Phycisphaerales bacterium]